MDALVKRVLEAYDSLGSAAGGLDLSTFAELARTESDAVRAVVRQLVAQGWLRPASEPDFFARTEDGRLQLTGPRDVTLYTRPGCHLCEEAKAQLAPLLREFGAALREINIDTDPVLRARYTNDVPVIFLGSRKVAKHRIDLQQFRLLLERSRP